VTKKKEAPGPCMIGSTLLQHAICRANYAAQQFRAWQPPHAGRMLEEAKESAMVALHALDGPIKENVQKAITLMGQAQGKIQLPKTHEEPFDKGLLDQGEHLTRQAMVHLEHAQKLAFRTCGVSPAILKRQEALRCTVDPPKKFPYYYSNESEMLEAMKPPKKASRTA